MPRDLESEKPIHLTESPAKVPSPDSNNSKPTEITPQNDFIIIPHDQQYSGPPNLHPYTRPLTISDLESVVALENAAFSDPNERATREKVSSLNSESGKGETRDRFPIRDVC